jgi:acyl-CoA reductase-like NAD-dependent aldehyde dehydrogenase
MVPGLGHEAGQAIVDHPGIAKIAFTGSTATGKKIMRDSSVNLKRLNLELGGKNPLIICEDADFGAAVETAFNFGFNNTGQFCVQPSRIYVHENIHDKFVEKMVHLTKTVVKVGKFDEKGVTHGPVISSPQLHKILNYIK